MTLLLESFILLKTLFLDIGDEGEEISDEGEVHRVF